MSLFPCYDKNEFIKWFSLMTFGNHSQRVMMRHEYKPKYKRGLPVLDGNDDLTQRSMLQNRN